MPTSCFYKTTKYYSKNQINGFINKHFKTNLSLASNVKKLGSDCAAALVQPTAPFGALIASSVAMGTSLVALKEYYDYGMAKKQANQVIRDINVYGGKMKVKFYDCVWTSSNGNSQSGFFPKYVISHSM